jgi:hypothetical protein
MDLDNPHEIPIRKASPMIQVNRLADALKTLFTTTANALGRELGVIRRQRIFTGSSLVHAVVFGWLYQPQASRDQMARRPPGARPRLLNRPWKSATRPPWPGCCASCSTSPSG